MKILIVGSGGSMGKRYTAILKHMHHEVRPFDLLTDNKKVNRSEKFDAAIVASPTSEHYGHCLTLIPHTKQILCEKPIAMKGDAIREIKAFAKKHDTDVRMVCNWSFVGPIRFTPNTHTVNYNFYNTGRDGFMWDCIQLVHLAKNFNTLHLNNNSPFFQASIDGLPISLADIERSYIKMIDQWINDPTELWDLDQAWYATGKVKKLTGGPIDPNQRRTLL